MKLKINNSDKLDEAIHALKELDLSKIWILEIQKDYGERTISQINLFYMWMEILSEESGTGYTKSEFHDIILDKFAPRKEIMGKIIQISIRNMNTKELSDVLNETRLFSLYDLGVNLPIPKNYKIEIVK